MIFGMADKQHSDIYRIQKDGSDLTKLTSSPGKDFDPVYSPDGSKIVFARIDSGKYSDPANLYIMNSDGSNVIRLISGFFHERSPTFSPDGQRIYFVRAKWFGHYSPMVSSSWKKQDICSIGVDGSDLKVITDESFYAISRLSISSDSKKILASLIIHKEPDSMWIIPIKNPKARSVLNPNFGKINTKNYVGPTQPQFSSDGMSVLFVWADNARGYFDYEIFIMSLKNGNVRQVTNLKTYILAPSFSPDGKEIVFLSDPKRNGSSELWLMNSDGTNPHRINIDLNDCVNCTSPA